MNESGTTGVTAPALTGVIVAYILVKAFGYRPIIDVGPTARLLFALAPLVLWLWQLLIIAKRLHLSSTDPDAPFYERIETGDWWRLFFILWSGQMPLATDFEWGFLVFTSLAVIALTLLVFIVAVEAYRKRSATPLLLGCLVFGFFLLSWERNLYTIHYGVPIIGHFLEKSEYDAQYRVEVEADASGRKFHATADIHVASYTEEEDWGDTNYYGQPVIDTVTYREILARRLHLPSGLSLTIDQQDESLRFGEAVLVEDSRGNAWYVRLLNEPIH